MNSKSKNKKSESTTICNVSENILKDLENLHLLIYKYICIIL